MSEPFHESRMSGPRDLDPGPTHVAPPGWSRLFEHDAHRVLAALEAELDDGRSSLQLGARLRSEGMPGDVVAALLGQLDLRRKARVKFGDAANGMLFTQAGLEQASRAAVARLHAERFARAGCNTVADLGCGIGSEALALMAAGVSVLAVEIDPFTARIAAHNLANAAGDAAARVMNADATTVPLDGLDGVFLDPARRTAGHRDTSRLSNPDDYSPSLQFAFDLAGQLPAGVKLGPGFDRDLIPDDAEAQWVSVDGQAVEMGLWFGRVRRNGVSRAALVIRAGSSHELTAAADAPDAATRTLGTYLYEPDSAVIRARLIGQLADRIGAGMVSEGIAYLTSDHLAQSPFARAFRITDQLPVSEKHLKRALAERGIGRLEIKKRGVDVDPAALRTRLSLKGQNAATLILTRAGGRHVALLAERV